MTVTDRADAVARRLRAALEASRSAAPVIARRPDGVDVTSPHQESIWLADRLVAGTGVYNVPQVLRIRGSLDVDVFRLAIGIVMERHEILHTRYVERDGRPVPVRSELREVPVTRWEPAGDSPAARASAAAARAAELVSVPFDLRVDLPLRAHVGRIADDDWLVVLVAHHIAVDGWALGVLWSELSLIYRSLVVNAVPPLPPLDLQYADYAYWQRARLDDARLAGQLAYWRDRLAGSTPTELPTDAPRRSGSARRGGRVDLDVPDTLVADLHRLAAAHRATLFHLLLAGFQVLLSRWTGRTDVTVGTLLAARDHEALEPLIGFFGTTVVIRTDLSADPTLPVLLAAVRDAVTDAHEHGDVPFERLVAAVQPLRELGRNPLFRVMFTVQDDEATPLRLPGCVVAPVTVPVDTAKFDLELVITRTTGPDGTVRLTGTVEYAADLYRRETIDRFVGTYLRLLADLTSAPHRPVSRAELLTRAERAQLVDGFNPAATDYPADALVHELIGDAARRWPGAVAVRAGTAHLDYTDLDRRANRLAHLLRADGFGPDRAVGVCLPRTPELVVALLGVLRAGAAYVPIDPDHPVDRVGYVLADSGARLVLTTSDLRHRLGAPAGTRVLCLDEAGARLDAQPVTAPARTATPDNLAYIIYTSGSTGRPKGVMVAHRAVVNLSLEFVRLVSLTPGDVVGAVATHAFDLSVPELLTTLMTGATIALAARDVATDGAALARLIADVGVTVMQTTPTTWRMLLDAGFVGGPLRVGASGETVPPALAAELLGRVERMWCLYGPTETTVWSTGYEVAAVASDRPMPIGRPLANNRVYVCDKWLRPVPAGVTGEIYIGGVGVSRGYAGRPRLTAERYLPDPFVPGGRLYRTGDLARMRPDGVIEFVGRSDSQVKVRGNRIELGEVEAVLGGHPDVAAAAVTTVDDGTDRQLVAYVVWRDAPVDPATLRGYLRATLPDAMVPTVVVDLPDLPLTPNRKVDRRALPPPGRRVTRSGHVPPRTPTEHLVVEVWSAVLGVDAIGVHDDFFQLGGHSLRGLQVAARLSAALDTEVSLGMLFAHPTPAGIAAALGAAQRRTDTPVTPRPPGLAAPLTPVQRRLWFLHRLRPGNPEYNVPSVLRLRGQVDPEVLVAAIRAVAARHDALRSRFTAVDGAETLEDGPPGEVSITDLTGTGGFDAARSLAATDASRPFDLGVEAPFRARVIRLAPDDLVVAMVVHHAVVDGWSLRLVWRDIGACYRRLAGGAPPYSTPPVLSHADYAYWRHHRDTAAGAERLEYWCARLVDLPICELPTDRPRPATWSGRAGRVGFAVPVATTTALRALARDRGATVFMVLLAAFKLVVSWFAGQDDIVIGTPVAGRTRPELENLVGCFVNTVVVRHDLSGDPTFADLVDAVGAGLVADLAHQDVPFEHLVDAVRPERDLSRNPLFQIMFRTDDTAADLTLPGVDVEAWDVGSGAAKFDLNIAVDDGAPTVTGTVEFAAELFEPATVECLARAYERVLTAAAAAPGTRLSGLAPSAPGDPTSAASVAGDAGAAVGDADGPGLPGRIARQAAATPDAIAVACAGERLSYAALDAWANRIGHWLRGEGVGPETVVAVALPRSPTLVATVLGVLRAGGAYLPLDPQAPLAHQLRVLADGDACLLLTDRGVLPSADVAEIMSRTPVRVLADRAAAITAASAAPTGATVVPDQRFAVFFTSGSTGRPKGVATLHGGVANVMDYLAGTIGLTAGDTVLQLAALTFDASIRDMLGPLTVGATVVLPPDGAVRDPYTLLATIGEHRVTGLLSVVPTTLRMLTTVGGADGAAASLRLVLVSGEPLTWAQVRAVRRLAPGIRLVNQYGPTETTMISTWHEVVPEPTSNPEVDTDAPVPVGRPIPGVRVDIVGPRGELLPAGALGEVYLAGAGLTRGYVGAPGATAERFGPDPSGPPGARRYRTGDLARWRPDGTLAFHGRRDRQLKIRGVRVEPSEIEAALAACPGVRATAVRAYGPADDLALAGYLESDGTLDIAAVRRSLAAMLPAHLIPDSLQCLPALPLTPHGKVDRAALPAPDAAPPTRSTVTARDVFELRMTQVWERVLGRGPIGVHDDFFAHGGHSLRAVELVEALRRELGVEVPLNAVFTHPTVEQLCTAAGEGTAITDELVVRLASGPVSAPPLFLIHPQGGDVCCYLHLARELAPTVTVHGVESVGYNTAVTPLQTIEEMSERYLREITAVAPGPYRLAGWSFGGNVAFEVAARLEATGHPVEFVGVIDARAFGREQLDAWFVERDEVERYGLIAELPSDDLAALTRADEQEAMAILLRDARRRGRVPTHADTATLRRMVAVFTANGRAADRYTTDRRIDAPIHLFTASDRHPTLTNPIVHAPSWQARTRGALHVVAVPGNHHDLVYPPQVSTLASRIREALTVPA